MPYLDKNKQREYQKQWVKQRRQKYLQENGPCAHCRSWNNLEIHHIDPLLKESHNIWSWCLERQQLELVKCQILCNTCHKKITREQMLTTGIHGTKSRYKKGCRCVACSSAYSIKRRLQYQRTGM